MRTSSGSTLAKAAAHDVSGEKRDTDGKWSRTSGFSAPAQNLLALDVPIGEAGLHSIVAAWKQSGLSEHVSDPLRAGKQDRTLRQLVERHPAAPYARDSGITSVTGDTKS